MRVMSEAMSCIVRSKLLLSACSGVNEEFKSVLILSSASGSPRQCVVYT
jgi:hypothetical protein